MDTTVNNGNLKQLASDIWLPPTLKNTQVITLPAITIPLFNAYQYNNLKRGLNLDTKVTDINEITAQLKILMTNNMGITRSAEQLTQALIQIQQWQRNIGLAKSKHSNTNNENLPTNLNELAEFQLARQLQLATLVIESAYQRLESRGGHDRQDYPQLATVAKTSVIEPISNQPSSQMDGLNIFMINNDVVTEAS